MQQIAEEILFKRGHRGRRRHPLRAVQRRARRGGRARGIEHSDEGYVAPAADPLGRLPHAASASSPSPARSTTATRSVRSASRAPVRRALARRARPRGRRRASSSPAASATATTCAAARSPRSPIMTEVVDAANRGMPRARNLQRLPDADRGAPASAGSSGTTTAFICRDQVLRVEKHVDRLDERVHASARRSPSRSRTARAASSPTTRRSPARGRGPRRLPLRRREPERLAPRHRGHLERARQRGGAHAAPRARGRARLRARHPPRPCAPASTASRSTQRRVQHRTRRGLIRRLRSDRRVASEGFIAAEGLA